LLPFRPARRQGLLNLYEFTRVASLRHNNECRVAPCQVEPYLILAILADIYQFEMLGDMAQESGCRIDGHVIDPG